MVDWLVQGETYGTPSGSRKSSESLDNETVTGGAKRQTKDFV